MLLAMAHNMTCLHNKIQSGKEDRHFIYRSNSGVMSN